MRVLQINSVCGKSSTGRIASDLASQIIQNNGDSVICYGRDEAVGPSKQFSYKIGSKLNVFVHTALVRMFDLQEIASVVPTIRLCRFIRQYSPDIIHLHNIHGYYLNYGILFKFLKKYNKPIVWTLHDCWSFTGHCSHFENVRCSKWLGNCSNCSQKSRYPQSFLFNNSRLHLEQKRKLFSGVRSMILVTPSEWLKNYVMKSFMGQYKVEVVNNGINRQIFCPSKKEADSILTKFNLVSKKIVLGVSTLWDKGKGLDDFSMLSKLLPKEYQIVLIGTDAKVRKEIPSCILAIDRTNSIAELAAWYSAAYVFVNPTYEDNFPTVNLEAISCGTPVIGYKTGGSVESILASKGIVVKQGDIKALADAIVSSNFQENARAFCADVSKQYDAKVMHEKYLKIYDQILHIDE